MDGANQFVGSCVDHLHLTVMRRTQQVPVAIDINVVPTAFPANLDIADNLIGGRGSQCSRRNSEKQNFFHSSPFGLVVGRGFGPAAGLLPGAERR